MHESSEPRAWSSVHLHFDGASSAIYGEQCDDILREIVFPVSRALLDSRLIDGFFFVRYSEGGCHVRLRCCGNGRTLATEAEPALREAIQSRCPEVDAGSEGRAGALRVSSSVSDLRWRPYLPETERYGGPYAMSTAEDLFMLSSRTASTIVEKCTGKSRSLRLGQATLATLAFTSAFAQQPRLATALCTAYSQGYLRMVSRTERERQARIEAFERAFSRQSATLIDGLAEVWENAQGGRGISETFDAYSAGLKSLRDRFSVLVREKTLMQGTRSIANIDDVVLLLGPSFMHMMCNRLGISIAEESYVGHLVGRALALADGAASPHRDASRG